MLSNKESLIRKAAASALLRGKSLARGVDQVIVDFLKNNKGNYLEIGCYDGVTLTTIANLNKDRICYGIDPFISDGNVGETSQNLSEQKDNLLANIKGKENIIFFEMSTEEFSKTQKVEDYDISIVLIDGCHIYDFVILDVDVALNAIGNKKGMIIFDDLHINDVKRASLCLMKFLYSCNKEFAYAALEKEGVRWINSQGPPARHPELFRILERWPSFTSVSSGGYMFFIIEEDK